MDIRYWAWQRNDPLDEKELAELAAQKVTTIYWELGELENVGSAWHWKARFNFPASAVNQPRFVPVVRIVSRERAPFSEESLASLVASLGPVSRKADELQLDYDAPDRLVADYSAALKRIHTLVPRLTITALPHWSRKDYLQVLETNVDELFPMLYDFEAEPVLKDDSPMPLIASPKIANLIEQWRSCRKPWRAGLPVFARLSLYDETGKLRGQIRNWSWEELCFNPGLLLVKRGSFDVFTLQAQKATSIANTPIREHEKIIVRRADRAALRNAAIAAAETGAQSVVFFRLPDSSASSGWSLHQLGNLSAEPKLVLRKSNETNALELLNIGEGDLEPRFRTSDKDRGGYDLEIEASSPIFREAQPGDFARANAYAGEQPAPIPFATLLRFQFAELRAGEQLRTGLIQLAPAADFRQTRYRILTIEGGSPWKSLE